jgi:hypothetical protein
MSRLKPLDTVVQAATVDLFRHYGVSVAPVPRNQPNKGKPTVPENSAVISFSSRPLTGVLSLSIPEGVFSIITHDGATVPLPRDLVRELANQLLGRVKSRLLHFQVVLNVGLPTLATADIVQHRLQRSATLRLFEFRTLRGDILVSLDGTFDETQLRYTGSGNHGNEGDVILF